MTMKGNRFVATLLCIALLCVALCVLFFIHRRQELLEETLHKINEHILHLKEKQPHPSGTAPDTKLFSGQRTSWSSMQANVKNAVVQIFAQKLSQDILQPFKTPTSFQGCGSGFFINAEGEIVTNAHVVDQAKSIYVQIPVLGKQQIDVELVGISPDHDIALLRVKPEGMELLQSTLGTIPFLPLGDSNTVERADEIMALGYPLAQQGLKSTTGVVSGHEQHLIQISAPINPGNSGGPSLNQYGEVIGINTAYIPDAQNVGYIIPINELTLILDDLHKMPLLKKPFLGILYHGASEALTKFLGNPLPGGLFVIELYHGSPLRKAGVQKKDMIYEINGHAIDIYGEIVWRDEKISIFDYISQLKLGQKIDLVIYRNGERKEISCNFDQCEMLPVGKIYPGYDPVSLDYEIVAGIVLQPLTLNHLPLLVNNAPGLTRYAQLKYQMKPAVVVTYVFPDSQAQRARALSPGAIIKTMNGMKIKTLDDVRGALFRSLDTQTLTLETTEGVFLVIPWARIVEEEPRLAKDNFYQLTPGVALVFNKMQADEQKQEAGEVPPNVV